MSSVNVTTMGPNTENTGESPLNVATAAAMTEVSVTGRRQQQKQLLQNQSSLELDDEVIPRKAKSGGANITFGANHTTLRTYQGGKTDLTGGPATMSAATHSATSNSTFISASRKEDMVSLVMSSPFLLSLSAFALTSLLLIIIGFCLVFRGMCINADGNSNAKNKRKKVNDDGRPILLSAHPVSGTTLRSCKARRGKASNSLNGWEFASTASATSTIPRASLNIPRCLDTNCGGSENNLAMIQPASFRQGRHHWSTLQPQQQDDQSLAYAVSVVPQPPPPPPMPQQQNRPYTMYDVVANQQQQQQQSGLKGHKRKGSEPVMTGGGHKYPTREAPGVPCGGDGSVIGSSQRSSLASRASTSRATTSVLFNLQTAYSAEAGGNVLFTGEFPPPLQDEDDATESIQMSSFGNKSSVVPRQQQEQQQP